MDKLNKLTLPITILVAVVILGGFYYAVQLKKQESIEKQQQNELQQQKEQQDREFDAKQKESCLAIYKQESSKWNNVEGWRYDTASHTCYIQYKQNPKKTKTECDAEYRDADNKIIPGLLGDYILCQDGLFEKSF